jgi:hypothetical protein
MSTPALPYMIVTGLLLLGLVQKLFALRGRWDDPIRRAMCFCLASLALATTVQAFTVAIDDGSGVPYLAEALSDAFAMIAAGAGRVFLIHVNYRAPVARIRARGRYVGLAATLVAVTVLFVLLPPRPDPRHAYTAAVYFYVYICYVSIALLSVCRLGLRYSRLTDRSSLRLGLRISVAGGVCGLAFLVVQAVMLVGEETGTRLGWLDRSVALPLEMGTQALLLAGVTIPPLGTRLGQVIRWAGDHRSYRLLHPLWLALHESSPELSLVPSGGSRFRRQDISFLLYRQVIEIRDGQLALRPYVHPGTTEVAMALGRRAGLSGEEARAAGEAAAIAAGIAAKSHGHVVTGTLPTPAPVPYGPDLDAEITWLTKVSRAFATSPVIPATLASLPASE